MKVGLLTQWFPPETGAAVVPGVLAQGLAERGHDVRVVTGFPNYPSGRLAAGYRMRRWADERGPGGSAVRRVALYPDHSRRFSRRAANYASFAISAGVSGVRFLRDAEAIWVYNSPATVGLPSALVSRGGGPPHLMHVMDLWPDSVGLTGFGSGRAYRLAGGALERWCQFTYREAAAIACISQSMVDILARRGVDPAKLHHVPVWTDESVYRPLPPDRGLAAELGVDGCFTILYAGNLGPAQQLDDFLAVCARLHDLRELVVLVAGSGTEEDSLRAQAGGLHLPNVRFLGRWPANDMGRLLSISDLNLVSLAPSISAVAVPSKLPGILACGRAVLAWAGGDVARIVGEAGAGPVVAPRDRDGMEAAIRNAYAAGPAALRQAGRRGQIYYREHLSLGQGLDAIEGLLESIAIGAKA